MNIIQYIKSLRKEQNEIKQLAEEIEFAHKYQDSIKGVEFWKNHSIFIGNWAGNYTFFYLISRILQEYKFAEIVEFGLGESTKFISGYLLEKQLNSKHFVVEHDPHWVEHFKNKTNNEFPVEVILTPLVEKQTAIEPFTGYLNLQNIPKTADLYIVDGPFGSDKVSRYDIVEIIDSKVIGNEFIVVVDDVHREGEYFTFNSTIELLKSKNIEVGYSIYRGKKSVGIIATNQFKYVLSY